MKLKTLLRSFFLASACSALLSACIPNPPLPPCFDGAVTGEDAWSDIYAGSDTTVPYLPDVYSNYWATGFDLSGISGIGFRIHGEFAYARYMSFNIYDGTVGSPLSGILDREIQPDCNSDNPFAGGDPEALLRSYTIHLVPEGTAPDDLVNPVYYDPGLSNVTILLRYYVPEGNETAQVPMPLIKAFDLESGQERELPAVFTGSPPDPAEFEDRLETFFATQIDDKVRFYNTNSTGLFANIDNKYLATAITRTEDEVIAIRFRPPTFAKEKADIPGAQVRYWSINLSDAGTFTYAGIRDSEVAGNQNDWVYFVIGDPDDADLMAVAAENGYNYIPWNITTNRGILIYRNLATRKHFDGDIDRVPIINGDFPINVFLQEARNFIGSYAPRGFRVNRAGFLSDPGGVFGN